MVGMSVSGNTKKLEAFLEKIIHGDLYSVIEPYAEKGVEALRHATPHGSGLTSESWGYEIIVKGNNVTIWWTNRHVVEGFNVAVGLQFGHGTGTGGWVEGYDYINPALRPIFDEIADAVWKEVQKA